MDIDTHIPRSSVPTRSHASIANTCGMPKAVTLLATPTEPRMIVDKYSCIMTVI